jgi:hypothetical protein
MGMIDTAIRQLLTALAATKLDRDTIFQLTIDFRLNGNGTQDSANCMIAELPCDDFESNTSGVPIGAIISRTPL